RGFLDEEVGVLRRIWIAKQDRAGLAKEKIPRAVARECITDLLGLRVFKGLGHTLATAGAPVRTRRDTPPWYRTIDSVRHRGPACRYARTRSEAVFSVVDEPRRRTPDAIAVPRLEMASS